MRNCFLFLLLMVGMAVKAQTLQGKVVDENTGEIIPFVSIGIVGTNQSTVTNDAGEFVLKNVNLPCKVRFSHVSYVLLEVELTSLASAVLVKLKPAAINLKTVVIDPFRGQRLLKAALEKAVGFQNLNFYGSAFYRQLTSINGKPNQIYELFYDLEFNVSKVKGWIAKQTRFAESNEGIAFSLSNQSYLTFSLAGYLLETKKQGKLVSLKSLKDFEISIDRIIEQKEQDIAVVSCKFKGSKKQFYINAKYYIGVNDLKIYRLENSIFNLPMTISAAVKIPPVATTIATFNGTSTPIPVLESIATKLQLSLNVNGLTLNPSISSMLTVYQLDKKLNTQKFTELNRKVQDKTIVESIVYDPVFWKDNPIVKQTALEESFVKMMENKSAFGTMIDPK
ncbi:carboxypeptidase-like regulatory domain-containing protein [Pedobacter helvus]|uniref:Carboxypeptidase-like regulatory domain-containing protein n=1 Tax=Pedobacter helvus TaxID=2563444 RepID=A0ABW9JKX2_9SPHI|nr:carboxypeptidase-like regulatory domain-containing protein [Pedobacter ureilyticus]